MNQQRLSKEKPDIARILESGTTLSHEMALACKDMIFDYHMLYVSPLLLAVQLNQYESARVLLEAGADVHQRDKVTKPEHRDYILDGLMPIHYAARYSHLRMFKLMLDHGADIDAEAGYGLTNALYFALHANNFRLVRFITQHTDKLNLVTTGATNALTIALSAKAGDEILELLINLGADVKVRGYGGWTPLLSAVAKGRYRIAELMIAKGADIHAKTAGTQGIADLAKDREWASRILNKA